MALTTADEDDVWLITGEEEDAWLVTTDEDDVWLVTTGEVVTEEGCGLNISSRALGPPQVSNAGGGVSYAMG